MLLAEIRAAAREAGPVPDSVRRSAAAAFQLRAGEPDRVLARLSYDSLLDEGLATRGGEAGDRRTVSFEAESLSVEVELTADRLIGQLVPPVPAEVELMTTGGVAGAATADARGCFSLDPPAPGPVRFRCRLPSRVVVTDWVRL